MVERKEGGQGLTEFKGEVLDVIREANNINDTDSEQYHLTMKPEDVEIKGKTGLLHEWVKMSDKSSQEVVQEGSVIEKYLSIIEGLLPEAKSAKTVDEAMALLKGKSFLFRKQKLGRSYEGKSAREVWTPVQLQ